MERTPTYVLRERVATECRLNPDDVDFLMAEHRAHIDVAPTGRHEVYRLTPSGHVGTIVGPGCRLVIRPKLPLRNFFHLLDPVGPFPVVPDRSAVEPGAEAMEFLAGRLAQLLAERSAAGLHRAYAERAEQGRFLQGQLDVPAHLREPTGRKDRLHCRYEDFSADVPCNQVPKATAELLLQSPLLGAGVRTALQRELQAFAAVNAVVLGPDTFTAAMTDRLTETYQPLLDLCRLLFECLRPGESTGPIRCPTFLLDMERLFERYVTRGVQQGFAEGPCTVAVQPLYTVNEPAPGRPALTMRPDVVVIRDGTPLLVVDAKWKVLSRSPLVTEDVYQVLAYCTALGVKRAVLVYPGRRNRLWRYPLTHAPITIEIRTLRVTGSRRACRLSLHQLGRRLQ